MLRIIQILQLLDDGVPQRIICGEVNCSKRLVSAVKKKAGASGESIGSLLKGAKLYCKPLMEDVICSTSRNFTRDTLESVADCGFVRLGENLVITARTGCCKTYLVLPQPRYGSTL